MPLLTAPATLVAPIPADNLDNEIAANRAAILALVTEVNAKDARIAALEAKVTATPVPTAVVYIDITAAQETALAAVGVGSLVVLRGPTAQAILERKP